MMKRMTSILFIALMVLFLGACAAQGGGTAQEQTGMQEETQELTQTQTQEGTMKEIQAPEGVHKEIHTQEETQKVTQVQEETKEQTQAQEEMQTTPDADWNIPETTEMTEEASELLNKGLEGLTGVGYKPVGLLGEKDGVYCILCRAKVVYPDAKPYYALVYVNDEGLQNIYEIWMGSHAVPKEEEK